MAQAQPRSKVGELRPNQILFSAGIGAVIDLPNLSTMVMGLDDWDLTYATELGEERLLAVVRRSLSHSVKRLLLPPIAPELTNTFELFDESQKIGIPVSPFPTWMLCPKCRRLSPLQNQNFELKTDRYRPDRNRDEHTNCDQGKSPSIIPARFLVACKHGHLDDFPWQYFVHRGQNGCRNGEIRLFEYGVSGSAADIEVKW